MPLKELTNLGLNCFNDADYHSFMNSEQFREVIGKGNNLPRFMLKGCSKNYDKHNDNPGTWAATLGEQLELEDFNDGNSFYEDFVIRWVRRALQEEYKFDDAMYEDMVDQDSLRVLSVNFESDRYNFALLCTVQFRYTFSTFYKMVAPILATEEAIELRGIRTSEIPGILLEYGDDSKREAYHPSTFLRLLLFFMHKNGYSRAEKQILAQR